MTVDRGRRHQDADRGASDLGAAPPPARRSESLFDAEMPEEELPEASRSGKRRTGLFDAEQEGWT